MWSKKNYFLSIIITFVTCIFKFSIQKYSVVEKKNLTIKVILICSCLSFVKAKLFFYGRLDEL